MAEAARMRRVVGWDVGGAHLKAARVDAGRLVDVVQRPYALWLGLDRLDAALAEVLARWPDLAMHDDALHAATMTGELADLFASRRDGVAAIAERLQTRLGARLRLFDADAGWQHAAAARARWAGIASANWLATARWLATRVDAALLVDVGSTTTDLVPIVHGRPLPRGRDDGSRLASGELVYHGVVRTPLAVLGPRIAFRGIERNVMNELFATSADVYRTTGELEPAHDQQPTADNAAKDARATMRRLARMIGLDADDGSADDWLDFARAWRARQLAEIERNARAVLALGFGDAAQRPAPVVVGAGCGHFLARALATTLGLAYRGIDAWMPLDDDDADAQIGGRAAWARVAAPCVAVALLAGAADLGT
jgi:probable H4MPT-linked C1 transfer pathway protein